MDISAHDTKRLVNVGNAFLYEKDYFNLDAPVSAIAVRSKVYKASMKSSNSVSNDYKPFKNVFGKIDDYEKKTTLKSGKPLDVTVSSTDDVNRQKELFGVAEKAERHKDKLVAKAMDELANTMYHDYTFAARDAGEKPKSKSEFKKTLENKLSLDIIDRKNDDAMVWVTSRPTDQSFFEWAIPSAVFDSNLAYLYTMIND